MLKLIKNEYAKIFLKKSTYIILAVCLLISVGMTLLIEYASGELEDYYYDDITLESELAHYSEDSNYIYDQATFAEYSLLIDMGYVYYMDIPEWVSDAVYNAVYEHYIYYLISENDNPENAQQEIGMYLDGVDIEYEKKLAEDMFEAIKAKDYKAYYKLCVENLDKLKDTGRAYSQRDYDFYTYMIEKDINPEEDEDRLYVLNTYVAAKSQYENLIDKKEAGEYVSEYDIESARRPYIVLKYIIENDMKHYLTEPIYDGEAFTSDTKFISAITSNSLVCSMAGIFVMIIAAGIVANEFSNGTIKFLLINPVKRSKIFWSKYATCVTLLVATMLSFFVIYFIFCLILCGTEGLGGAYLTYADGKAQAQSIMGYALEQYLLSGISMLVSVSLAFTISSLMKSAAVAISFSFSIEFLGATIIAILAELGHDWGRYLIFANTDLANISNGISMFAGHTLTFALVVVAVYMVVFLLTAYDAFTKKEV